MSNINQKIYLQKMEDSPEAIKKYVSGIFLDNSYLTFLEKYRNTLPNKQDVADILQNEVLLFLIKINSIEAFIENFVEILDVKPLDAEKILEDFFTICIPKEVQNLIKELNPMQNGGNKIEEAKLTDPEHISHHDLLSEIENPTPSISTTTDFQNQNFVKSSQPQANTPVVKTSANKGINTATTNTYTNPALNIATKLDQKLSTPSASIPKDIYVSKKPDPYHEPVDL
ncbi:MAG: hypothetical protein KBB54_02975 [Candidatus Pacebacteria bacterium]|nr:hypothetical protein [Candidatus Paceibacterota bacterium]MBP9818397.1 hypothetical protein [Candidatus Paceibacterota bacterium]